VESANLPGADRPLQNLPFCRFRPAGMAADALGVGIGDRILDLGRAVRAGALRLEPGIAAACLQTTLNAVMGLAPEQRSELRLALGDLLADTAPAPDRDLAAGCLVPLAETELLLPAAVGDYTDFYTSIEHATNLGRQLRPENPLLPNYRWVPIGYHGRASSLVVSGTPVVRPSGQRPPVDRESPPEFGPTRRLDYEVELGWWVGPGNPLGEPVPVGDAPAHLAGVSLLNDWSARDLQAWEYQPLGPFLGKSFATLVSPWAVSIEALDPFRHPARPRLHGEPAPLPYLSDPDDQAQGGFDITLQVSILTLRMRESGLPAHALARVMAARLYWTPAQLVAHHTSNGCNLRPGDLLGSGTISNGADASVGSLSELTDGGRQPVTLPSGETRSFLEDGDEVVISGWCQREGFVGLGFGECRGRIEPSRGPD